MASSHTRSLSQLWSPASETGPTSPPPKGDSPTTESGRQWNRGKRISQIVKLKPECVAEYKKCHAHVWPEVLKQIKACNIVDCQSPRGDSYPCSFSSLPSCSPQRVWGHT